MSEKKIADLDTRAAPKPPADSRECPFGAGMVPNVDKYGRVNPANPVALVRGACTPQCALYDVENGRNCLERIVYALAPAAPVPVPPCEPPK